MPASNRQSQTRNLLPSRTGPLHLNALPRNVYSVDCDASTTLSIRRKAIAIFLTARTVETSPVLRHMVHESVPAAPTTRNVRVTTTDQRHVDSLELNWAGSLRRPSNAKQGLSNNHPATCCSHRLHHHRDFNHRLPSTRTSSCRAFRCRGRRNAVRDFLKDLPTRQSLYFAFTAAIVAWLAWRACLRNRLQTELNQQRQQHVTEDTLLTDRDWTVVATLRHRAFQLRGRAAAILVGIFLLLFCGIYLVLFIPPKVLQGDRTGPSPLLRADTLGHLTRGHHGSFNAGDHKPPSKPPDRELPRSLHVHARSPKPRCRLHDARWKKRRADDTRTSGYWAPRRAYNSTGGAFASGSVEAPEGESFAFASLSRNGKNALVATRSGHVVYRQPDEFLAQGPNFGQITRRACRWHCRLPAKPAMSPAF